MALTKSNFYKKPSLDFSTSWDDGHITEMKTVRLLEKYGIRATFYIPIDYIDKPDHLTWDSVKGLDRNFEIGGHTVSHPGDLKLLYDDELHAEIYGCKGMMESVLGHEIRSFCYPRGRYNEKVINHVMESGFLNARTTKIGKLRRGSAYEQESTVHVFNGRPEYTNGWFDFAKKKLQDAKKLIALNDVTMMPEYHLWGHGWEIERDGLWDELEEFFKLVKSEFDLI